MTGGTKAVPNQQLGMSENALGKAGSGTDADGKDASVECPTCGRTDFKTRRGMKSHHKHVHGESIAGVELECSECGSTYYKKPNEAKSSEYCSNECKYTDWGEKLQERESRQCEVCDSEFETTPGSPKKYCSHECYQQVMGKSGEDNPMWRGDDLVGVCEVCGDEFRASSEAKLQNRRFCSKDCMGTYKRRRVELECEHCEGGYEVVAAVADMSRFCSLKCKSKWQSIHLRGEDSPTWKDGYNSDYGPNWRQKRKEAVLRDQCRCQDCGKTPTETGRDLDVHHVRRINDFDRSKPEWYKEANDLSNLITLCRKCHGKWEGIPLKPQVN